MFLFECSREVRFPLRLALSLAFWLTTWTTFLRAAEPDSAEPVLGMVAERPAQGPFVETDQGFMVPYEEQIPDSNVRLTMIPVPGGRLAVMPDHSTARRMSGDTPDDAQPWRPPPFKPSHFVTVAPFWIGKYEITWGQFEPYADLYPVFCEFRNLRFRNWHLLEDVDAVTVPTELYVPDYHFLGLSKRLPVTGLTQFSARQYTKWLSQLSARQYRLPAEAEWEYACRAGTTTQYSWGDDMSQVSKYAVVFSGGREQPDEVGTRQPNPWGLYDMHGNMAEWVLDGHSIKGIPKSNSGELVDLVRWPTAIHSRVVRGGWWETDAHGCRSASRMGSLESWSDDDPGRPVSPWWHCDGPAQGIGFRIARSLDRLPEEVLHRVWDPDCEELSEAVIICHKEGHAAIGRDDGDLLDVIRRFRDFRHQEK